MEIPIKLTFPFARAVNFDNLLTVAQEAGTAKFNAAGMDNLDSYRYLAIWLRLGRIREKLLQLRIISIGSNGKDEIELTIDLDEFLALVEAYTLEILGGGHYESALIYDLVFNQGLHQINRFLHLKF